MDERRMPSSIGPAASYTYSVNQDRWGNRVLPGIRAPVYMPRVNVNLVLRLVQTATFIEGHCRRQQSTTLVQTRGGCETIRDSYKGGIRHSGYKL